MPTNRDLLEAILKQQKTAAQAQYDFAAEVSTFMNKQEGVNARLSGYLENNDATGENGLVAKNKDLEQRVEKLETSGKVTNGKIAISVVIITSLAGLVSWVMDVIIT